MAEHLGVLILIVGLCLFVAFVIWIIFFMKYQRADAEEITAEDLEDGGEILIITQDDEEPVGIYRPKKSFSWLTTT